MWNARLWLLPVCLLVTAVGVVGCAKPAAQTPADTAKATEEKERTVPPQGTVQKEALPETEPKPDPLAKLGGPSRDLNAPLVLGAGEGDPSRQQVLVYYANDSSVEGEGAKNLQTLGDWLRSSTHPEVAVLADKVEQDVTLFSAAVEQEMADIRAARAALPVAIQPAVVLINNTLARQGKMELAAAGKEFRQAEIPLPASEDGILQAWPLADPQVLDAVLKAIGEQFPPEQFEIVLVTKSHGSPDFILTTRIAVDTTQFEQSKLIGLLEANAAERLAKFKEQATPLTDADGKPILLAGEQGVFENGGELRADGLGPLRLAAAGEKLLLVDLMGRPVQTQDKTQIELRDGALYAADAEQPLQTGDQPAAVELLRGLQNHPIILSRLDDAARSELFATPQHLLVGPLAKFGLTATGEPLEATASAEQIATAKSRDPRQGFEGFEPVEHGVLDPFKTEPFLDKMDTLGKSGTLDPFKNAPFLDKDMTLGKTGTLEPMSDNTLDINEPVAGFRGTKKEDYVATLLAAGERGQQFPLIFAESCRSQFGREQSALLKAQAKNIGYLWTSDQYGLRYQTLPYADLFDRLADGERLSLAMLQTLVAEQRRQAIARASGGAVPDGKPTPTTAE
ncbi:hypothetical protein [Lignipirellula cremea]|uniref:Uncharacterized protein n=1 Tax=Lignipirellula cremea TaxID=2528010 RepID=A0A518DQB4_9BACT|nr:hypothetical protein [Lignipirellula cremea]QDU94031.1 hypothetical protein Pla8534_18170 [Lignipirellula cremea]